MQKCILLSGQYSSGKTTLSNTLQKILSDSVCLPLANSIKDDISRKLEISKSQVYSKPTPAHLRELIKSYGTFIKTEYTQDYWCDIVYNRFIASNKKILIIDDIRFAHEYHYFRDKFTKVYSIFLGEPNSDYELEQIYDLFSKHVEIKPNYYRIIELLFFILLH